jgi:predicted RNase H-like nuclease (RuvC/YqgF family)
MWQQILSVEGVRLASGEEATVLHLPSTLRGDRTMEERLDELARWSAATREPGFTSEINGRVRENLAVEWARTDAHGRNLTEHVAGTNERLAGMETELAATATEVRELTAERDELLVELGQAAEHSTELTAEREALLVELGQAKQHTANLEQRLNDLEDQLGWITSSRTWRLRGTVLRIPGVARLIRRAGAARSR